jgi:hypothetical protein
MWPKVGDEIKGNTVYGKGNTLTGEVTSIHHDPEDGDYTRWDIVTITWDNGVVAKFYREHLGK